MLSNVRGICVALLALAAVSVGRAQEPPPCKACDGRGTLPCGKHGKLLAQELPAAGTVFCSVAIECKVCSGALATDCGKCVAATAEQELAQRREMARTWLDKRRKAVDDVTGNHTLAHLETTHVDLVCSIKPLTVGKEKLDTHALMHLYASRIEALVADYRKVFELTEADMPGRLRVYLFRDARDHAVIGPRETGIGNAAAVGLKQMGPEFVYSMWQEPRSVPDDEALHRNVVHNVTHLLTSQALPVQFLGNKTHGWIDEGLAHWFEDRITGRCLNYCFEEVLVQPMADWKGGRWRTPVRQLVDAGKMPSFAQLASLNTDQLTFEGHAAAFAWVDFLVTVHGGPKFRDLVRLCKQGQPIREALSATYGKNPLTIEEPFRQWVKATYPPVATR